MKHLFIVIIVCLLGLTVGTSGQRTFKENPDSAYSNAMMGIEWCLNNIPADKKSLSKTIIKEDIKLAEVKLTKEVAGVKIVSRGYHKSTEVEITTYRSYNSLKKENYIKEKEYLFE